VGEATEERHLTLEDSHFDNTPIDMTMDILLGKTPKMHREATTLKVDSSPIARDGIELNEAADRVLRLPTVA
jgi:phosphoribosylformylglycinamidine synthase